MSILWNFDKYAKIEELPFDPLCINADDLIPISDHELLLKAGTPLALYEAENEGGGAAKGPLRFSGGGYTPGTVHPSSDAPTCFAAEDYHFILTNAQQPKLVKCVTKGYIEKAKVLEAMGAEEDPTADWKEDLAALGLYLVDDLGNLPGGSGGGSSGGGLLTEYDTVLRRLDKTAGEILDVFSSGGSVVVSDGSHWAPMTRASQSPVGFEFVFTLTVAGGSVTLHADELDDYPSGSSPK